MTYKSMTKAQLLEEITKCNKQMCVLQGKLKKYEHKLEEQNGCYKYLYTADNLSFEYLESLETRTREIRHQIYVVDEIVEATSVRMFSDKNRAIICRRYNKKDKTKHVYAMFYKYDGDDDVKSITNYL